jgi:F-type H+-transporting ATPase subunit delta
MSVAEPDVAGTVFDEETTHIARIYAEALLNVAAKTDDVESVVAELEEIEADVLRPNPQFAAVLDSFSVPTTDKDRILTDVFEGRATPSVVRFLKILNQHGRLGMLVPVIQEARALWDQKLNRRPVLVKSAVALDDGQKTLLHDKIAAMIHATPVARYEVDPSLIGGLVIQDGDNLYDASIKTKLATMRKRLIEGKMRELSSHPVLVD